jgi:hypothetical protein
MRVLRLRQSLTAGGGSLVAVDYDPGQGASSYTSKVPLLFELNEHDRSRLRFYLENFLTCPNAAALKPVADLRDDLRRWGEELFRQVFKTDRKALWHYEEAARDLHSLRIEILADQPDAWTVPWELLFDPNLGWLAPQVRSFARLPMMTQTTQRELEVPFLPVPGDPLRVLYVVGRPAGSLEIPFHSVARSLLQTAAELEERLRIDILRPPTFERLAKVLSQAVEAGRPYHVLHFDGHGVFTDSPQDFAGELDPGFVQEGDRLMRRAWTKRRGGARGYLIFEDLEGGESRRLVDGVLIGNLMARTCTPLLVLHACQSATARTEALERLASLPADTTLPGRCPASAVGEAPDDHDQDLALQALAAEVMRSSPRAAVALPWTLPPVTATRLLGGLYTRIAEGAPVSEAAGSVRAELLHGVRKESVLGNVEVDDWLVPTVHEAAPMPLCDPGSGRRKRARAVPDDLPDDSNLPGPPAWGFVERPEVLFTLDRAFDVHGTVLLHAFAGAGKTALAREFALWYRQSGGLGTELEEPGILLWSSFEDASSPHGSNTPFDAFERSFAGRLLREGVWAAAGPEERREIALQILREVPSFWVWDNVEQIGSFEDEERRSLADFLRDLGETRCKVLLLGRRPEDEWLGSLPCRIALPPMPMEERGELTIRIAARHGLALRDLMSFAPLLRFSQGNPLTLSFLLNVALREGCRQPQEVDAFLSALQLEESCELLISLSQGYQRAFGEEERQRLALLHLFQDHVDLNVLCWMGHPEAPWCLPQVRNLGRGPWAALLDRAVRAGLLTSRGKDCYGVHPALPLFFRGVFERLWKDADRAAARAFAESMAGLGSYYHRELQAGNRDVLAALLEQEANLLHARTLARDNGWWSAVVNAMQGLETLYLHTGRQDEWKRLVRETVPEFVDPETEQPLPGREEFRDVMNGYVTGKERG